ncbi:MAG: hypothetical protein HRU41_18650 [Saprospiraceae bacterium]|nr:hypothetical protein [Saprospiraceae bacterium]
MPKHVLILGCGRSGTSIFGELFEQLSCYTYYSEPPYASLKTLNYQQAQAVKVPKESEGYAPTTGLSFPLEDLLATVKGPLQVYWQVRHPLDTICSLRLGISRHWGHHPRPHDWEDWLDKPLLEQCAYHWNYINTIGYQQVQSIVQISRFEDMLANPIGFALDLSKQLGVDIAKHRSELEAWARRVQNTNNEQFVEAKTSRPYSTKDHKVRVGRWRENLAEEEMLGILPLIHTTMKEFNYDIN